MACSPTCGAFHAYADDISAMQASEPIQLFLKERQARNWNRQNGYYALSAGARPAAELDLCLQKIAEKERKYKSD